MRSRLVSQPSNKSISNTQQSLNATDLSPITFGVILPPKQCGKKSTNYQISQRTLGENENSKVCIMKILLDSGASELIVRKGVLYKRHRILKDKKD